MFFLTHICADKAGFSGWQFDTTSLRNDELIKYTSLLGLFRASCVKKPRRSLGYACVFCLAGTQNADAKLVHFINPSFLNCF